MSGAGFALDGAVAVVTGASRGIGRATAVVLARQGAHVVIVARSTARAPHRLLPGTLDEVEDDLRAEGRDIRARRSLGWPANRRVGPATPSDSTTSRR